MDNSKAVEEELTFRPLAETVEDVRDWYEMEGFAEREGWVAGLPPARGMTPESEASLLREYSDAKGGSEG